jgi:hypothetical protein
VAAARPTSGRRFQSASESACSRSARSAASASRPPERKVHTQGAASSAIGFRDEAVAAAAEQRLDPQQDEGHAGHGAERERQGQLRARALALEEQVHAVHEVVRAAGHRHHRAGRAEVGEAALPRVAGELAARDQAQAGVGEPGEQREEAATTLTPPAPP